MNNETVDAVIKDMQAAWVGKKWFDAFRKDCERLVTAALSLHRAVDGGAGSNCSELLARAEKYISINAPDGRGSALLVMELADALRSLPRVSTGGAGETLSNAAPANHGTDESRLTPYVADPEKVGDDRESMGSGPVKGIVTGGSDPTISAHSATGGPAQGAPDCGKVNDAALAAAIQKMRKLRLIDHVPIKDSPPPAVTFLAVMKQGLGGCYEDGALEYIFRHFLKYYRGAQTLPSTDKSGAA